MLREPGRTFTVHEASGKASLKKKQTTSSELRPKDEEERLRRQVEGSFPGTGVAMCEGPEARERSVCQIIVLCGYAD